MSRYLRMLVELIFFQKKKVVGFFLLGHTDDPIDEIFNHFAIISKENVGSFSKLIETINKIYCSKYFSTFGKDC